MPERTVTGTVPLLPLLVATWKVAEPEDDMCWLLLPGVATPPVWVTVTPIPKADDGAGEAVSVRNSPKSCGSAGRARRSTWSAERR